jgi:hypothetical protein
MLFEAVCIHQNLSQFIVAQRQDPLHLGQSPLMLVAHSDISINRCRPV